MLTVGILFVLPQVVGFAATRAGRRVSAALWPLAAMGTIGLLWALAAIVDYRAAEDARAAGAFYYGEAMAGAWIVALFLMVLHLAVGSILGVLDQRARSRRY
jgi:hypothetical protein